MEYATGKDTGIRVLTTPYGIEIDPWNKWGDVGAVCIDLDEVLRLSKFLQEFLNQQGL